MACLTQLVSPRPRDASESFCLANSLGIAPKVSRMCRNECSYKFYQFYDFLLHLDIKQNLRFFVNFTIFRWVTAKFAIFLRYFVMLTTPSIAGLRILQNLAFFAINITQTDRQRWQTSFCSLWGDKARWKYAITIYTQKRNNNLYVSLLLKAFVVKWVMGKLKIRLCVSSVWDSLCM